jgi:alginate O-acetyltransferase complex protein AlgJ
MGSVKASFITGMAVTAIFIASLWLPTVDNIFNIAPSVTGNQKSQLSQLPAVGLSRKSFIDFQSKYVKLFIDNFGFRDALIRWNSLLKLNFLKVHEFPKVLVGHDDWLYLIKDDEGNNALDYYRSIRPFASDREIAEWAQPLVEAKKICDRKGVRFLLLFAPMKPRIYPEYVPRYLEPVRATTRLDQLAAYLKKSSSIDFIDLGGAVLEGKKKYQVFFKHDVHWNSYGSYYAYRAMAGDLKRHWPRVIPRTLEDYRVDPYTFPGGDLAAMLGLKNRFTETYYNMVPKRGTRYIRKISPYPVKGSRFTEAYEYPDPALPRAVVFHDSFFNFIKPYLADNFSRMMCMQSYYRIDLSIIDIEKPDVVIYEMAESFIQKSPSYVTLIAP